MTPVHHLTAREIARRVRAGDLSPVDVVSALLDRIDRLEPAVRAWAWVDREGALEQARRVESAVREGRDPGPLAGVPVGVKDILYTKGLRTAMGSPLFADFVPAEDAEAVARLRAAGAILLGKTVTTPYAFKDPPPTRNPWDLSRTPGGSSSGSGAGVACRMVPVALGTQTGGSILRPSAYNGVVGLKPTYGRISRHGVFPLAWSLDTVGVIARRVEDCALLLGVLAGHDPRDPGSARAPVPDYLRQMEEGQAQAPRLGLVRGWFYEQATPEVRDHTEEVARRLHASGAQVQAVELPPSFEAALPAHRVLMRAEGASVHRDLYRLHPEAYGPEMRALVEEGHLYSAVEYLQAQRHRRRFQREVSALFRQVDVLLMPTVPAPAPPHEAGTGDPGFQAVWTLAGLPSLHLPTGLSAEGLPLGVQLVGPAFGEGRLLACARWCERALGLDLVPPIAR